MIYLQMPKTGTTHIVALLQANFPLENIRHNHEPIADISGDSLVFGSIRNPYDWYLSYWHSQWNAPHVFEGLFIDSPEHFQAWMKRMFTPECERFFHPMYVGRSGDTGLYSIHTRHLYRHGGEWSVDKMIKTENIDVDLAAIVGPITTFAPEIRLNEARRQGQRADYYNAETIDAVTTRDRAIFERFGYSQWQ